MSGNEAATNLTKGLLFKDEYTDELMFRCPNCNTPHSFSVANSFNQYSCSVCWLTLFYPEISFLEVLVEYRTQNQGNSK